ncbi:hypothetical protein EON66_04035 [archaeon]|nr:MAG: hypothetical protein EON66_04035 [archaeon]
MCSTAHAIMSSGSRLSKLQTALRAQLEGAQFRQLNETLYTQSGTASFALLSHQPHLFHAYHKGYRNQVADWPQNPLDIMIAEVKYVLSVAAQRTHTHSHIVLVKNVVPQSRTSCRFPLKRAERRRPLW